MANLVLISLADPALVIFNIQVDYVRTRKPFPSVAVEILIISDRIWNS